MQVVFINFVVSHGSWFVWSTTSSLGDVNEVDLSLKYTRSFNKLNVSPGYTLFPSIRTARAGVRR